MTAGGETPEQDRFGGLNPIGGEDRKAPPPQSVPPGWGAPQGPSPQGQQPQWISPPAPPPTRKNRKALLVTLLASGAVILVVVLVGVIVLSASDTDEPGRANKSTAIDAAKGYLNSLAAGDADAALAYGSRTPPDTRFLTDEILQKQLAISPITDISVQSGGTNGAGSSRDIQTVDMSAEFGDGYSKGFANVRKSGVDWRLDTSFVELSTAIMDMDDPAVKSLTLFGVPLRDIGSFYVFPGALEIKSMNRFIDVQADPVLLSGLGRVTPGYLSPKVDLSEAGRIASKEAVDTFLRSCIDPGPPDCPNWDADYGPGIDPKSVRFKETQGLDDMANYFLSLNMTNALYGYGDVVIIVSTPSGPQERKLPLRISGSVDLTKDPPIYSPPDR